MWANCWDPNHKTSTQHTNLITLSIDFVGRQKEIVISFLFPFRSSGVLFLPFFHQEGKWSFRFRPKRWDIWSSSTSHKRKRRYWYILFSFCHVAQLIDGSRSIAPLQIKISSSVNESFRPFNSNKTLATLKKKKARLNNI